MCIIPLENHDNDPSPGIVYSNIRKVEILLIILNILYGAIVVAQNYIKTLRVNSVNFFQR